MPFDGLTAIIDVELLKAKQFLAKPVLEMTTIERWAVFFRYVQDPTYRDLINEILNYEEAISMAAEELLTVSEDEILRARYEYTLKNELDWQSGIVSARRAGYKQAAMEYEGKLQALEQKQQQAEQEIAELKEKLRRP